eukprot:CAMPEP_0202085292 /NCGR_PEP_ID=MMETSP0964-20121228/30353_1 /ASSEMBLY_ACC=CAM_ASM_000500 /TAXON_ID=4773 /ORGANISM="Schizochytrium aggregatum, Strain ATCC28209" /LENGTH=173 /DNA_ID=CAMNT_0048653113 /DNA_START=61 /DNA_END=582 /DNA_ORIENTATION=+
MDAVHEPCTHHCVQDGVVLRYAPDFAHDISRNLRHRVVRESMRDVLVAFRTFALTVCAAFFWEFAIEVELDDTHRLVVELEDNYAIQLKDIVDGSAEVPCDKDTLRGVGALLFARPVALRSKESRVHIAWVVAVPSPVRAGWWPVTILEAVNPGFQVVEIGLGALASFSREGS